MYSRQGGEVRKGLYLKGACPLKVSLLVYDSRGSKAQEEKNGEGLEERRERNKRE